MPGEEQRGKRVYEHGHADSQEQTDDHHAARQRDSECWSHSDLQSRSIRRDKLSALHSAGRDPFAIVKFEQTAESENIKANFAEMEGKTVVK